jgi:hypothetical protein
MIYNKDNLPRVFECSTNHNLSVVATKIDESFYMVTGLRGEVLFTSPDTILESLNTHSWFDVKSRDEPQTQDAPPSIDQFLQPMVRVEFLNGSKYVYRGKDLSNDRFHLFFCLHDVIVLPTEALCGVNAIYKEHVFNEHYLNFDSPTELLWKRETPEQAALRAQIEQAEREFNDLKTKIQEAENSLVHLKIKAKAAARKLETM